MLCIYHDDLDGRCAAAIVRRHAGGGGRYFAAQYRSPLPLDEVTPDETVVIVDFSLPPEDMARLRRLTNRITWIDHHASAIERDTDTDLPGVREIGRAACELTWHFYYPDHPVPRAVELAADRDVWTWRFGEETAAFCEGIRLTPHEPTAPVWDALLEDAPGALDKFLAEGAICRRYQSALAAEFIEHYGFETEFDGQRCYAANLKAFGSDVFGERFEQYAICICFVFDGRSFSISLYSRQHDVLPVAIRYGGGGHRRAAGFESEQLPFSSVPGQKLSNVTVQVAASKRAAT